MKPWFVREGEVINFPKKDDKVIKLPAVDHYDSFFAGVRDLQAKLEQGDITKTIYDKLYQDLIHKFAKKESAETPWFLKEFDVKDRRGIMSLIQARLQDPNLDNETIQKVLMALEGGGLTKRLQNVMEKDPDAKKILQKATETVLQSKGTAAEVDAFIKQYEKGLVNIEALTTPGKKSWSDVFVGYEPGNFTARVVNNFYGLKNQGIGPGEVCLSVLSKDIFHSGSKPGAGDIFIQGAGHYEIKGSQAKPGRLYDTRKAKVDMNTIQNIRDQLKLDKTRVNLKDLIAVKPNQAQVTNLITSIMRYVPQNQTASFVNAILTGNEADAKMEHTKMAYANYKAMTAKGDDTFVGIIFMSQKGEWTNTVTSIEELVQNLAVGTIYVMSPDVADFFPQTTFKFS